MDFQFLGGNIAAVAGEKITRLTEYPKFTTLIIVCASEGARMQEGSLSLMKWLKHLLACILSIK